MEKIKDTDHFQRLENKLEANLRNEVITLQNRINTLNEVYDDIDGERKKLLQPYEVGKSSAINIFAYQFLFL